MSHLKLRRIQDSVYWWQFLLGIVNISGILSYKIPKYIITNTIYFDNPQFYGFEVFLSNVWIVSFKQQDEDFF